MGKLLNIHLIKSKLRTCPLCHCNLEYKVEDVATYSGKGKSRKIEDYTPAKLNYCKRCNRYYIKQANLDKIKTETNNSVLLVCDTSQCQETPKVPVLPLVEPQSRACPVCRRPMDTNVLKLLIHVSESSEFANGFLGVNVPYCSVCHANYVRPNDTLIVNDLMQCYKRLSGQPKLEKHEIVTLLMRRLGIDPSNNTTCDHNEFPNNSELRESVPNSANKERQLGSTNPQRSVYSEMRYSLSLQVLREVHICFGDVHCYRNDHCITECKVSVYCSDNNGHVNVVSIYANYCATCDKYFMQYTVFKTYQDRYGNLLVKFTPADEHLYHNELRGDYFLFGLKEESLLHVLGYNTQILSAMRKLRLVTIMACAQMKKSEIIRHLDYLIRFNGNNPKHCMSIRKWKDDLEFVADYELDEHDHVFGQIVMRTNMIRKAR